MRRTYLTLAAILLCAIVANAQGADPPPDIQQLKEKLASLEQMMNEVKGRITALEARHATAPDARREAVPQSQQATAPTVQQTELHDVAMLKPPEQTAPVEAKKSPSGSEATVGENVFSPQ